MHPAFLALAVVLSTYSHLPSPTTGTYQSGRIFAPALPSAAGYEIVEAEPVGTVAVVGNVLHPGEYDYYPGMTIESVIGDAGSFRNSTDYENLEIVRMTAEGEKSYTASWFIHWQRLVLLKPGDVLIIPNRSLVSYY